MNNAKLKEIVNAEIKNMRKDLICEIRDTQTGIFIGFTADHGKNRFGVNEYAFITGYKFHRIQDETSIIKKLHNDGRLYA